MLAICRNPDVVNGVINHPSIRPFVGPGVNDLDISEAVERPENWPLIGEYGGFLLAWSAPGIHEVHTFVKPEGRGKWARDAAQEAIGFAKTNGDQMLWTKCPPDAPHVAAFAVEGGMKPTGEAIETFGKPYAIYKMELN